MPLCGFVCRRGRFRFENDESVQISIDTRLDFFVALEKFQQSGLDGLIKDLAASSTRQRFPFAVMEVRLASADRCPRWLAELMASPMLVRADNFSKFQHSIALFYPNATRSLPEWMNDPNMMHYTASTSLHLSQSLPSYLTRALGGHSFVPPPMGPAGEKKTGIKVPSGGSLPVVPVVAVSTAMPAASSASRSTSADAVTRRPPKVEPKTLFANERTLLQWLNSTVILSSVAVTLVSLPGSARVAGIALSPVAIIIAIYSLWVYHRRRTAILGGRASTEQFEDPIGPYLLVPMLILAVTAVAVFNFMM